MGGEKSPAQSLGGIIMKLTYPCFLTRGENSDYILECVTPSIFTFGKTLEAASKDMHTILLDLVSEALENKEPFPYPDNEATAEGERVGVSLTPIESIKVMLINAMIETKTRQVDIAEKLGIPRQEVTRIINPRYRTKLDTLNRAIEATGKHLQVSFV